MPKKRNPHVVATISHARIMDCQEGTETYTNDSGSKVEHKYLLVSIQTDKNSGYVVLKDNLYSNKEIYDKASYGSFTVDIATTMHWTGKPYIRHTRINVLDFQPELDKPNNAKGQSSAVTPKMLKNAKRREAKTGQTNG